MKISRNSWHTRVYLWWYSNKYGYYREKRTTNLCPYMRVVMFWAPLRALFWNWISFGKVSINFITIPALMFIVPKLAGYLSYGLKIALFSIEGAIILIGLLVLGIVLLSMWWDDNDVGSTIKDKISDGVRLVAKTTHTASFGELVGEFFRSAHDGICPQIEIVGDSDETNTPSPSPYVCGHGSQF